MMHRLVGQVSFYALLLQIDEDLAEEVRKLMCPYCGGVLHRANFPRVLRGAPRGLAEVFAKRFSFCCGTEGCRLRRTTPPSVRFFGRRWFAAPVVVLVSALRHGATPRRLDAIQRWLERPVCPTGPPNPATP